MHTAFLKNNNKIKKKKKTEVKHFCKQYIVEPWVVPRFWNASQEEIDLLELVPKTNKKVFLYIYNKDYL